MVVCDSAPLIHLSRVNKLGLLKDLFGEVEIPPSIYREVVEEARELGKPGVSTIEGAIDDGWLKVTKIRGRKKIKKLAESEKIQIEDAEVLYLAKDLATSLVTSDGWLIKIAKGIGVETLWTTTLVLLSIKEGKMSKKEGKNLLRELVTSGLYIKPDVYAMLLQAIDEM
ncbi:hypothetical protein AKJ44_01040 [candidate division MSBL1 archaeon SCGC-AAA261F17]|uniref:DUF3368 domain-containing protein n=1 Tax=candidate division MSBL1 archaeon SCGC-AAA261F17 TaxID=1698274 RepID=A0A133V731_9EURY|nr:hypothetical protein AKJ44_01040 [candidate division MSBL1 archaeon SCGC-AAA261F17]